LGLRRYDDALAAYEKAIALRPDFPNAWLCRGDVFFSLNRYAESLVAYDRALMLNPDFADAWRGRANAQVMLGRPDQAFAAYDKALALTPSLPQVEGARLYTKMILCDWSQFSSECERLTQSVRCGNLATQPFECTIVSPSPADQLKCAQIHNQTHFPSSPPIWQGERYEHDRICVAYVSADFHEHPVALLLASIFEQHDRKRFETIALSLTPESASEMRTRLKGSFDRFIDVSKRSDMEVAQLLRALEVDIAVDLMGYTAHYRLGIFAHRPSPVQVNYLGYPGTTGSNYIDYILADRIVIPEEQQRFYSEKVVYLPDSFMGTDNKRKISHTPTRAECGLPASGFVFCSFNNSYKITPTIFDIWMRLLRQIDGSVFWLSGTNETAIQNLRREAESRGVDPQRLVFAARVPRNEDHLARLRLADLFLDTMPYNAHATGSDALWAGLPIVTCLGETFAARVGGSLLQAAGLPDLVTRSLEDYEALALKLARDPALLASVKARLQQNLPNCPLFNTERFTRNLEEAYTTMYKRHQKGEPPINFTVETVRAST